MRDFYFRNTTNEIVSKVDRTKVDKNDQKNVLVCYNGLIW